MSILPRGVANDSRGKPGAGYARKPEDHLQTDRRWQSALYRNHPTPGIGMPGVIFKEEYTMNSLLVTNTDQNRGVTPQRRIETFLGPITRVLVLIIAVFIYGQSARAATIFVNTNA